MPETVNGLQIRVSIVGSITGDDGKAQRVDIQKEYNFADGTAANQVGQWFYDETRPLNNTSEDLDLNASLPDFQGTNLSLNNMKVLFAQNLDLDAGDTLTLKTGSTNPVTGLLGGTTPTLTIGPGGLFLLINPDTGYTVTPTTADKIAFQTTDDSTYKLFIAGDNA